MNKIKEMWNGLSKRGKIVAGALGAILILTAPIPYALALSRMQLSTTYPIIVGINGGAV